MITVYVYGFLLIESIIEVLTGLKEHLGKRSKMKDMGEVKVVLGLEINRYRKSGTLKLSQSIYAAQVLDRFNISDCKTVSTPMEVGLQLSTVEHPH